MRVCIGGTFDILHEGHKRLLHTAFKTAGEGGFVFIGITSGFLAKKRLIVAPFAQRKKALEAYLSQQKIAKQYIIKSISDKYGPAIEEDFDAIVVSPETQPVAEEINQLRTQKGKKSLRIILVPFVLAQDNQPISSSRIRRKEIDSEGRILGSD